MQVLEIGQAPLSMM